MDMAISGNIKFYPKIKRRVFHRCQQCGSEWPASIEYYRRCAIWLGSTPMRVTQRVSEAGNKALPTHLPRTLATRVRQPNNSAQIGVITAAFSAVLFIVFMAVVRRTDAARS